MEDKEVVPEQTGEEILYKAEQLEKRFFEQFEIEDSHTLCLAVGMIYARVYATIIYQSNIDADKTLDMGFEFIRKDVKELIEEAKKEE